MFICFFYCILFVPVSAQRATTDTLVRTLQDLERQCLTQNLNLLARQYNIDLGKAAQLQARLWMNPTLNLEQNFYNTETQAVLPLGSGGQKIVGLSQVFQLAGQRNKLFRVEALRTKMAEYAVFDLMRTLRYELRSRCYAIYYAEQNLERYKASIRSLRQTVELYKAQYQKGNVPLKDVVRLSALVFDLENEREALELELVEHQAVVRTLLGDSSGRYYHLQLSGRLFQGVRVGQYVAEQLLDSAVLNRHDLRLQHTNVEMQSANLSLQKALAVPNLEAGVLYDQAGSYVRNYTAFTLQMDLPVWNRNQGNIRAAQVLVRQGQAEVTAAEQQIWQEVQAAHGQAVQIENHFAQMDTSFFDNYDRLIAGVRENYEKKNISLIEFIDFYENYKKTMVDYTNWELKRAQAIERLNYTIASSLFKTE